MDINFTVGEASSDILCEFLEVAVHSILYTREIYPPGVFTRRNKYNVPVQISSHPLLSEYISDMVTSIKPMIQCHQVDRVDIVIVTPGGETAERFVFEIMSRTNQHMVISDPHQLLELEQTLRAFLLKLNISDTLLKKLPEACSWTIQVHTKDSAAQAMQDIQLIQDFTWIPAESSSLHLPSPTLTPLKSTNSGPIQMQLYVEESSIKDT